MCVYICICIYLYVYTYVYIYICVCVCVNAQRGAESTQLKQEMKDTEPCYLTVIQGSLNRFLDIFRMGTFIDSTHMKL